MPCHLHGPLRVLPLHCPSPPGAVHVGAGVVVWVGASIVAVRGGAVDELVVLLSWFYVCTNGDGAHNLLINKH